MHKLKEMFGLAPDDDVVIGKTGDVYNAVTGERIGPWDRVEFENYR